MDVKDHCQLTSNKTQQTNFHRKWILSCNSDCTSKSWLTMSDTSSPSFTEQNEEEKEMYFPILQEISKYYMLDFLNVLECGPNGAVAKMKDPFLKKELAIKVEPFEDEIITRTWYKMSHSNILPLIEFIPIPVPNVPEENWTIYVMPFYPTNLRQKAFAREFREDPLAFQKVRQWIYETVDGLAYMHEQGYYHLDMKEDNILLNDSGRAVLADFTFLTNKPVVKKSEIGCPFPYKPPEFFLSNTKKLISEKVDMWALAITIINVLTSGEIDNIIPDLDNDLPKKELHREWKSYLRPFLKSLKNKNCFVELLKISYPRHEFADNEVDHCWRFVKLVLKEEPGKRATAADLLKHDFLSHRDICSFTKDISMRYLNVCENCSSLNNMHVWELPGDLQKSSACKCTFLKNSRRSSNGDTDEPSCQTYKLKKDHRKCEKEFQSFMQNIKKLCF